MDSPDTTQTPHEKARDETTVVHRVKIDARIIWQVIGALLLTSVILWMLGEAQHLLVLVGMSFFFSLALQPAVLWLVNRYEWRRGSAVGVIYLAGFIFTVVLVVILIPAIAQLASAIGQNGAEWVNNSLGWVEDTFNVDISGIPIQGDWASSLEADLDDFVKNAFGSLLTIASTGIGLVFDMATMAMFTFYFTADAPRFQRAVLGLLNPDMQYRVGWAWDQAIIQTGGYFYSRVLLMIINGFGFFFTMVAVGMPVGLAVPLALFGGFVSVFIPAIGTYLGGAIPILLTLAIQGLIPAVIVLAYVLIYQQIENYWLSPRLSARTMTLNGALAFGAALAGGAVAGPIGAFISLPVAALITAMVANFAPHHDVAYTFSYDEHIEAAAAEAVERDVAAQPD